MSFPIDGNIPAATNYPGDDQPRMKANFANIKSYLTVDHVQPGDENAGDHKQVTFAQKTSSGALPSEPISILATANGTASAGVSQLFWNNQNSRFHMSSNRAWGFIKPAGISLAQTFNVASVVQNGTGRYTVTLTAGAVSSDDYGVLVSSQMANNFTTGVIPGYQIISTLNVGPGKFQLNFKSLTAASGIDPDTFSFQVMQI